MLRLEMKRGKGGGWFATIQGFPELRTYGSTRSEAIVHAKSFVLRLLAHRLDNGEPVPELQDIVLDGICIIDDEDGPILASLKIIMTCLRYTSLLDLLNRILKKCQGRKFCTEWYVLLCMFLSILSILFSVFLPYECSNFGECLNIGLIFICGWSLYRLYDILRFLIDWIFVVRGAISSPTRSLLLFMFNIIEVSILMTVLKIIFTPQPVTGSIVSVIKTLFVFVVKTFYAMVSLDKVDDCVFFIDSVRFMFGLIFILVIVAGLVSQLVRSARD